MKYFCSALLALSLWMGSALPAAAQWGVEERAAAPAAGSELVAKSQPNSKDEEYPVCGIDVGGILKPGDDLEIVFGVAGPPDQILPMRSRSKEPEDDYIHFIYRNRFTVNINKQNVVQSIIVFGHNVKMVNVPFKVGQKKADVLAQWKKPEREASGMLIYFYRGVYFITEKNTPDQIDRIYLTLPGKVEEDEGAQSVG